MPCIHMATSGSFGDLENPWASMPQERDLGGGVGLEDDATSKTSRTVRFVAIVGSSRLRNA